VRERVRRGLGRRVRYILEIRRRLSAQCGTDRIDIAVRHEAVAVGVFHDDIAPIICTPRGRPQKKPTNASSRSYVFGEVLMERVLASSSA